MKYILNGTLVVEGKEDASYLSNYIASEIVVVNGFEIKESTISYLKNKQVIALLDPDDSGIKIRQKINNLIPNVINVDVDISKCSRGSKNGVAECEISEILRVLGPYFVENKPIYSQIKQSDLYNLGLINNKEKRLFVCQKLDLGECNNKTFYKRLIINNISYEKLCAIIEEYKDGN